MTLYQVYSSWVQGKLSDEQVAEAFQISVKVWKFKVTRYGKTMGITLKTLDRIAEDQITREEASKILGVTPRAVNLLMETWGVKRPLKEYLIKRSETEIKWEIRKKGAIEYIAGTATLEEAAEIAMCTDRQMRRWITELLHRHLEMPFKDLKLLSARKRKQVADEIEEAEGLEMDKINAINEVSRGSKQIRDLALERVVSRYRHRRGIDVQRTSRKA